MARKGCASAYIDRTVPGVALVMLVMAGCAPGVSRETPAPVDSGPGYPAAVAGGGSAASSVEPPGGDDHDHDAPSLPAPAADRAASVAATFAAAWVRSDLSAATWWRGVEASCEESFARSLRTVDPSRVPATRVTGRPVVKHAPQDGKAVFEVPTDAGTLTVWLAGVDGRWLVVDADFRRAVSR